MKITWCMVPEILSKTNRFFLSFWTIFCTKNQNFEKMNTTAGNIIILHKCTKNHNHMVYCSWDITCDRCNCYFSFWAIFCPLTPITCRKIENFKKMKKTPGDIIILHNRNKNHDHMLYCSWDMGRDGCNFCFSFWAIFCPFTAQKIKISRKWKKAPRDVIILHMCSKTYN